MREIFSNVSACSRWLHRCCGRLRPYCTPSWRHSRVQQRLGRTAPRYYIIRGPGKVHGGAGGGGSGGRNEGAPVGDSPPFVPVSQSWLHRRCAHRGARVDERDVASSFVPGHCSRRKAPYTAKYISLHLSYRRPGVQPLPSLSEIVLDFGTCEVMNNRKYVIWRYDSPAVDVLDADEAELICAAQIADCLSLPARVVAPPWMRHLGWGRAVSRGGRLRARGHQSSKSAAD